MGAPRPPRIPPPPPLGFCWGFSHAPSASDPPPPPCSWERWGAHSGHPLPCPFWVPQDYPSPCPGGGCSRGGGGICTHWQSHPVTFGKLLFTVTQGKWCRKPSHPFSPRPPAGSALYRGGGGTGGGSRGHPDPNPPSCPQLGDICDDAVTLSLSCVVWSQSAAVGPWGWDPCAPPPPPRTP